jgi:hypothetical protein
MTIDVPSARFSSSRRDATFTVSPTAAYLDSRGDPTMPAKTSPLWTATPMDGRIRHPSPDCRSRHRMAACISTALTTACHAWSGSGRGAPNRERIPSPTKSWIMP